MGACSEEMSLHHACLLLAVVFILLSKHSSAYPGSLQPGRSWRKYRGKGSGLGKVCGSAAGRRLLFSWCGERDVATQEGLATPRRGRELVFRQISYILGGLFPPPPAVMTLSPSLTLFALPSPTQVTGSHSHLCFGEGKKTKGGWFVLVQPHIFQLLNI